MNGEQLTPILPPNKYAIGDTIWVPTEDTRKGGIKLVQAKVLVVWARDGVYRYTYESTMNVPIGTMGNSIDEGQTELLRVMQANPYGVNFYALYFPDGSIGRVTVPPKAHGGQHGELE